MILIFVKIGWVDQKLLMNGSLSSVTPRIDGRKITDCY